MLTAQSKPDLICRNILGARAIVIIPRHLICRNMLEESQERMDMNYEPADHLPKIRVFLLPLKAGSKGVTFSIFHLSFVICHCLPRAVPSMTNDKWKMINGK
jgi:hypothetical protein